MGAQLRSDRVRVALARLCIAAERSGRGLCRLCAGGGVFLVTFATALAAAALALAIDAFAAPAPARGIALLATIVAIAAGGAALGRIEWTTPAGSSVAVSLVQGNIAQDLEVRPGLPAARISGSTRISSRRAAAGSSCCRKARSQSSPMKSRNRRSAYLQRIAAARNGDVLAGLFTTEPPAAAGEAPRYYNSVVSLGAGRSASSIASDTSCRSARRFRSNRCSAS